MLLTLLLLTILECLMFWSTVVYEKTGNFAFQQVMSITMSVVYGLLIIMYIPLFTTVMERLRIVFPGLYNSMKTQVTVVFVGFMILMFFRYSVYLCLQFAHFTWLNITKLSAEIPFYISELIIAFSYSWFLIKVFRK